MVRSKHYAEAGIQSFVFLPIIIYGWYNWLRGPQNEKRVLTTREISLRERNGAMFLFGVGAIGIATLYYFYDPDLNYLVEAPLTMLAAIALFFMARKTFQTWKVNTYAHVLIMCATLWSGINLRGIQVYTYIVLCLYGWWMWYRENGAVASSVD